MKSVFIIEDDINILYGLRDLFASNDYEVRTSDANDSLENLLDQMRKFKPRIIILDLVLPKLDGLEIVRKIKEDDALTSSEIFIFTDLSDEDGRSRSVGLGANYYFVKNEFDIYSFANRIMRIMDRDDKHFEEEDQDDNFDDLVMN
ncbi:MAG: response regulator transcription factor [Patescibacteria group bacterium]|jgi:DNA-binding response OmpR family regulator|nr:response regulator [Patescibacteria group bacterium]